MTVAELDKFITWNPSIRSGISTNFAALMLAEATGCDCFRLEGRVFIEASDAIAEVCWMNRKQTMMGVREASI